MRRVRSRRGNSFSSERIKQFRSGAVARGFLLLATGLLCSVSGVTENREESRSIIYSDWQERTAAESSEAVAGRVGSFRVGRPESEKFIGGLFDEWREIILPEFGRVDPLLRQGVRDKLFLNQESVDFNEYLRGRQADLLLRLNRASADYLTGSLTEGMEAGAGRHSFVRNVEWDYQSKLGKRRWQTGLNVVGALRETAADAIVWQLRGYAAKDSSGGANAGLIYRRVVGEGSLAGANVFLDYEDHDYGSFSRWSLGGEVRGGWGGVFVNRYMVLSGERKLSDGRTAYSRDGFDVATEFRVPKFRWVSGGLTYYRFDGEHGDADEKGFRYHGAFDFSELMGGGDFWGGLSFALEYDNGSGGDWGGRVSYRYAFDAPTPSGSSGTAESFDPRAHFFDPVRREYAQRISRTDDNPKGRVTVHLMATEGATMTMSLSAFIEYSTTTITLSGTMTVASYPVTAVATIRSEADSRLSVHFKSQGVSWAARLEAETTVVFEGGRELEVVRGDFRLVRTNGGTKLLLRTPSVTVNVLGPSVDVNIEYPAIGNRNYPHNVDVDLDIGRGNVSVDVAGALTSHIYDLIVHATEVQAEIVSEGGKIRVPPAMRTVSVLVPAVEGETVSYTLPVANGEQFSHRYNGFINPPSGWTVSPEGVVGSPQPITGVTVITVTASNSRISFIRSPEDVLQRISETWVISFDTREPAPPAPPPDSSEMVSVHLYGSSAFIEYSTVAIILSGVMTVASYPVTAVATIRSGAASSLSVHFGSQNVGWTTFVNSETTIAFENDGRELNLHGGNFWLIRNGGITLLRAPSVRVNLLDTFNDVNMEYPTYNFYYSRSPISTLAVTDVGVDEGRASVYVAGPLAPNLQLDVDAISATAVIVSREGTLTVPPVDQTIRVSPTVVVGEPASYTLQIPGGERFSHRYYNDIINYPSGWTVNSDGVLRSISAITGSMVVTVVARSDSIRFSRGLEADGSRLIFAITGTWIVNFVTKGPVGSSVTSALRAVEDYTGGVGTAHFEAMLPGVATGASNGVPSLTTPLPGMNRVVTVAASDSPMSSANAYFGLVVGRAFGFCVSADDLNGSLFQAVGDGGRWGKPGGLCLGAGRFRLSPFS